MFKSNLVKSFSAMALAGVLFVGSVGATSTITKYPQNVPNTWENAPFLKQGIVMEFNENNNDWEIEIYYPDIALTRTVDIPENVLDDISLGQKMYFLIKDSNYTSEWAGNHTAAFEHYKNSCLREYKKIESISNHAENKDASVVKGNEGFMIE